jgi:hypothetical protein
LFTSIVASRTSRPPWSRFRSDQIEVRLEAQEFA